MPYTSPLIHLGMKALGETIQLAPGSPALAVIRAAQNVLQLIDGDKTARQDEQRLARMVLDIAIAFSDGMRKLDKVACKTVEIERISDKLLKCLESISRTLVNKPKNGLLSRLLRQSSTKQRIEGWEADLEQISILLTTEIQLQTARLSQTMSLESDKEITLAMEERIRQANEETLEMIKSQVMKQTRKKLQKSSFGHFPPAASPIFFGRSIQVERLVDSLVMVPAYHAIIGPPGIGKTSVALNVLHDPRTIKVYGKHRYFLACETTSDAGGVIAGLADIFSLNESSFIRSFKELCGVIESNILFLLDNFETPWERVEGRQRVEDLLTDLSNIPNVSIVITLRGAERPGGLRWSHPFLPALGPLEISDAIQTFVTIADVGYGDSDLAKLLEEVEFIPLAITLLAAQASYTSCAFLLRQWQTCKTSMVTRGGDSRLSSLDVSISLSLTSSRFVSNPDALSALQTLSLLPDGATMEELQLMTRTVDIYASVSTLLQVALATTARHDRIRVLSPIREYMQSMHPIPITLFQTVFSYHAELSRYARDSQWTTEAKNVDDKLNACIGNVHYVIRMCLNMEALAHQAINASINVASFRHTSRLGSIGLLLEEAVQLAREAKEPALLVACLQNLGSRMWFSSYDRPFALGLLQEAALISRSLSSSDNCDLLVSTLQSVSLYLNKMFRDQEAFHVAREAVDSISSTTSPLISALAYLRLGESLLRISRFSESRTVLECAGSYFNSHSSPLFELRLLGAYANMYILRDMYKQCVMALNKGLSLLAMVVDSDNERARYLTGRGRLSAQMSRFENARSDHREAIKHFASSGSAGDISRAYCELGVADIACGNFDDAELSIQAANQFQQTDVIDPKLALATLELHRDNLSQCLIYLNLSLKELALHDYPLISPTYFHRQAVECQIHIQQRAVDALPSCVLAAIIAHKSQDRSTIAASILWLGDMYLFIEKDVTTSRACYQAHLDLVRYLGTWRWIANALLRLGVTDYLQGDSTLAILRINQAAGFHEETDGKPWVSFCQKILSGIGGGARLENIPIFPPLSLFGF